MSLFSEPLTLAVEVIRSQKLIDGWNPSPKKSIYDMKKETISIIKENLADYLIIDLGGER